MPLIKNNSVISDIYYHANDSAILLPDQPATVSLERWLLERQKIIVSGMDIGIRLKSNHDVASIKDDTKYFAVIILNFPNFTDGRAYSQAGILRQHFGYGSEIRATGDVAYDQLQNMQRSGFDAFEVVKKLDIDKFIKASNEVTSFYQASLGNIPLEQVMASKPTGRHGLSIRQMRQYANSDHQIDKQIIDIAAAE